MACAPRCGVEPAGARLIAVACGHRLCRGTGWASSYLVCSEVCMVGSMQPTWKEVERALVGVQKRGMSENGPWVMARSRDTPDTNWASHLGPPLCSSCHTPQSSKIKQAHIPLQRGGACVGGWLQLGARWVMGGEGGGGRKPHQIVLPCDLITLTGKCRNTCQTRQTHVVGMGWVRVTNSHPVPAPAVTCSTNLHGFINPWHSLLKWHAQMALLAGSGQFLLHMLQTIPNNAS